jgi:large subunit ribosomal protein L37Ae
MVKTKKLKSAARFGARYGKKIKTLVATVESRSRAKHVCPACGRKALKRVSAGIWLCRKCGKKIAGGAYSPTTAAAEILMKVERLTKLRENIALKENEAKEEK